MTIWVVGIVVKYVLWVDVEEILWNLELKMMLQRRCSWENIVGLSLILGGQRNAVHVKWNRNGRCQL